MTWQLICGDAREVLAEMPEASVDALVSSPPYFAQRSYGDLSAEIGRESTPDQFVAALVSVFRAVRRVLKPAGCLWINIGDSYCSAKGQAGGIDPKNPARRHGLRATDVAIPGLKCKDLIGVPWLLAFALRSDGWYLRSDTIWHKPNPMPGSALDRPTSAHEYCFLLSKSRRYYFDSAAIREPLSASMLQQMQREYTNASRKGYAAAGVQDPSDTKRGILKRRTDKQRGHGRRHAGFNERWDAMSKEEQMAQGSLPRSVWTIPTNSADGADLDHFALMPRALARKMVISACPAGGVVLDPFAGCATTGVAALEEGRSFIGIELNPAYAQQARHRLASVAPLLAAEASA